VRVQYRSLGGATTGDEAAAYLSSMALARCGLLFVIDTGAASAADRVAPKFPQARFYVVGGGHAGRNVVTLRGSTDEVAAQVRRAIVDAAPH
jgi:basic membrane lipoprotein Med (substrate-binding protein (PBP1-ABC) superfamily)